MDQVEDSLDVEVVVGTLVTEIKESRNFELQFSSAADEKKALVHRKSEFQI